MADDSPPLSVSCFIDEREGAGDTFLESAVEFRFLDVVFEAVDIVEGGAGIEGETIGTVAVYRSFQDQC